MLDLFIFLGIFVVGTLFLAKTSSERHFILFMIRTKHFLRFIDNAAGIAPRFWKFIADFAIVVSFSGLGAAYLSRYREKSRNLDIIVMIFGIFAVLLWAGSLPILALMLIILLIGIKSASRVKNPWVDFLVVAALISSILLRATFWYLSVLEGIFGLLAIVVSPLIENALAITSGQSTMPGVSPIIPWVEAGRWGFVVPGLGIFVPLVYGLIALILLLIVHEFSHGILARVHGLDLKSTGLLTLGPLPIGAFVEPDEEKFKKSDSIVKMRVLSMGSFANLTLAIVCLSSFIFLIMPSDGLIVKDSGISGIENGTLIMALNGMNMTPDSHISATMSAYLFSNRFYTIKNSSIVNKTIVNLTTNKGVFPLNPEELSGIKMLYVPRFRYEYNILGANMVAILVMILFWTYFFNFNIALVNLLPIVPFDGGKMVIELVSIFNLGEESVKKMVYAFLIIGLLIILINAYPLLDILLEWLFSLTA